MAIIRKEDNKYYFDAQDGTPAVECPVWIETSKKNVNHPDGKPWIKLPKGNITNRQYFSEELFNSTNVNGEVEVEVKTSAPRVLGTSGVKQAIIKYLDEEAAAEYTDLVNNAVDAYKAAKADTKKKKMEDMTAEELEAYIEALRSGKTMSIKTGPKSFIDMFTDEQYARYNELIALAQENKANMPRAKRGPLSEEEKAIRTEKRKANTISKAEKLLAALRAGKVDSDEDISDDDFDAE